MGSATTTTAFFYRCPDCGETVSITAQRDREGLPYLDIEHPGPWCPSIKFDPTGRQPPHPGVVAVTEYDGAWLELRPPTCEKCGVTVQPFERWCFRCGPQHGQCREDENGRRVAVVPSADDGHEEPMTDDTIIGMTSTETRCHCGRRLWWGAETPPRRHWVPPTGRELEPDLIEDCTPNVAVPRTCPDHRA